MDQVENVAGDARRALAQGRFEEASGLFDQALATLGEDYAPAGTIDDTGMKAALADADAKAGRWAQAAALKARILDARLALTRRR